MWDFSSTAMRFSDPGFTFDGGTPITAPIVWFVMGEPQIDPNVNQGSIFRAVGSGNRQGAVIHPIFGAPQADPTQIKAWITQASFSKTGQLIWNVIGEPQGDPSPIQQPWLAQPAQAIQAHLIQTFSAFPQNDPTPNQSFIEESAAQPASHLIGTIFGSPQVVDLSLQASFSQPILAAPIIPNPIAGFFVTLPQFEERPTRVIFKPLVGHAIQPLPFIKAGPQLIDLSPQGWIKAAAQKAQGKVPKLVIGQPPQQDFTIAGRIITPLARSTLLPIRLIVASPQLIDLSQQGLIITPIVGQGAVPAFTSGAPPEFDYTIQGFINATAPGMQGTTLPGVICIPPQSFDFTLQPWIIPDDAEPPAAFTYWYTVILIEAVAQLPFKVAESSFIEQSACLINTTYLSLAGTPFVPASIQYRIDDVTSGANIVPLTSLDLSTGNQVIVTAAQNAMISNSLPFEQHEFSVFVVDGTGQQYVARQRFIIVRTPAFPDWINQPCGNC